MSRFCFRIGEKEYCIPVVIQRKWTWPMPPEDPFVIVGTPEFGGPPPTPWLEGAISKDLLNDVSAFATIAEVASTISNKTIKNKMMSSIEDLASGLSIPEGFNFKIAPSMKAKLR